MIEAIKALPGSAGMTPEQIASAINAARLANPGNYQPVSHAAVKAWLAESGLSERLKLWLRASEPALDADLTDNDVQTLMVLRSGIDNVLSMGPGTELLVAPGDGPRQLLEVIVGHPPIPVTQDDADRIINRALKQKANVTPEQVQAALDEWEAGAVERRFQTMIEAGRAAIDAGSDEAAIKAAVDAAWGE